MSPTKEVMLCSDSASEQIYHGAGPARHGHNTNIVHVLNSSQYIFPFFMTIINGTTCTIVNKCSPTVRPCVA